MTVKLFRCIVCINIHKKILSFFFFLSEVAQIWRGSPANRKSHSTVLTTHARLPIHLLHRIYQWDKTFFFLFLRTKFRNRAMLYGETVIELLFSPCTEHRSWSLVVLSVHKWHLIRYWVWNKTFCYREIKDEADTIIGNFRGILIDWVPGQGSGVWDFNLSNAI